MAEAIGMYRKSSSLAIRRRQKMKELRLLSSCRLHMQGSVVLRTKRTVTGDLDNGSLKEKEVSMPSVCHDDIIGDNFWKEHPELLA